MNFIKIKVYSKTSSLKNIYCQNDDNEIYINIDQVISFNCKEMKLKTENREDQILYQINLDYNQGARLKYIVSKKYYFKIKTVLDINSV
tara:strand:+ start:804 stop:1070 length:267 start_codon:yes stop_codon:yes gene_type:complete